MKNKEELAKINKDKLKKIAGGTSPWSEKEGRGGCEYICYNPKCVHYGHFVHASIGPKAVDGGYHLVCDFCDTFITSPNGSPVLVEH